MSFAFLKDIRPERLRRCTTGVVFAAATVLFCAAASHQSVSKPREAPAALASLAAKAQIKGRIAAWCNADFGAGAVGAFAIAVIPAEGAGQYVALAADGNATTLAPFNGGVDLACYSRREAENLNATIRASKTIQGGVKPRSDSTVVCGFVEDTRATCWQFSPKERAFMVVGGWIT